MKKIINFNEFLNEFNLSFNPISNVDDYIHSMNKGLTDKLFFLNKIDIDTLVDFGSADGTILNEIYKIKDIKLIGYDIDNDMIEKSKNRYPNIDFYSDWNDVLINIKNEDNNAILLSSVIHEVYSYGSSKEIGNFWNQIFDNKFDYVVIRDMIPSIAFDKMNSIDINKIRDNSDPKYLKEYEDYWGDITTSFRVLLHWLLKYKYTNNWDRELKENYLPVSIETLKKKIPSNWKIIYEKHYTYDHLKNQIKKDFDVELEEPTHLKMIIKNEIH
jgi:hypothetical protein